jgi:hypothetical protein
MNHETRIRRLEDYASMMERLIEKQGIILHELVDYIKLLDQSVDELHRRLE